MFCNSCHHWPSSRFDAEGRQCYCQCHDASDFAAELLEACKLAYRSARVVHGAASEICVRLENAIARADPKWVKGELS